MATSANKTVIISVEGSIGAGKTTLLRALENAKFVRPHVVSYEPVDEWMNSKPPGEDKSVFAMYYEDKHRWGFMFQMFVLQTRVEHLVRAVADNPGKIIITERCPLTDCEVFAKMLHEQNIIKPSEYYVYDRWYSFVRATAPSIDGLVYLMVDPSTCAQRITRRNRAGEDSIDMTYLNLLHDNHEAWLGPNRPHRTIPTPPVLIINGNQDGGVVDVTPIQTFVADVCRCAM
jgi:deoxyadenosine/deoxycytidine kinase